MNPKTRAVAISYLETQYPKEGCGFVVESEAGEKFIPCENVHPDPEHFFRLSKLAWAIAEDQGEIIEFVHSHPKRAPLPSHADLVACEKSELPWTIISLPGNATHSFSPSGYKAPLIGRQYCFGVLDCLTLICDYYAEELGINLQINFSYEEDFWEKGQNLYMEKYKEFGFKEVEGPPQPNDVLLMKIRSAVPNHGAIYLGDAMILHHLGNRLSTRELYGSSYRNWTSNILRYQP